MYMSVLMLPMHGVKMHAKMYLRVKMSVGL